jgi:hypothetical protein
VGLGHKRQSPHQFQKQFREATQIWKICAKDPEAAHWGVSTFKEEPVRDAKAPKVGCGGGSKAGLSKGLPERTTKHGWPEWLQSDQKLSGFQQASDGLDLAVSTHINNHLGSGPSLSGLSWHRGWGRPWHQ